MKNNEVTVGSKIKIVDGTSDHGFIGVVSDVNKNVIYVKNEDHGAVTANLDFCYELMDEMPNRNRLAHFIKTNNIRTTLVSRYLGYSKGWLTQAMTRKDRGDLDDHELQEIMNKLHINWSSDEYVHVKATKQHTAYKTKPCSHTTELHKARLQQSFWNGEFTHG